MWIHYQYNGEQYVLNLDNVARFYLDGQSIKFQSSQLEDVEIDIKQPELVDIFDFKTVKEAEHCFLSIVKNLSLGTRIMTTDYKFED